VFEARIFKKTAKFKTLGSTAIEFKFKMAVFKRRPRPRRNLSEFTEAKAIEYIAPKAHG